MGYREEAYLRYCTDKQSEGAFARFDLDPEATTSEVAKKEKVPERIQCHVGDVLRVRRFFETFIGFHEVRRWALWHEYRSPIQPKGDLDLTGRWPRRYASLLARMLPFLDDVDKLRPYVVKSETTVTFTPDFTHTFVDYTISSPSLEAEFMKKYQLAGMNVEEILEKSGETVSQSGGVDDQLINRGHAERIKSLLAKGSQPKFQSLSLLQLPNELLFLILRTAGIAEARLLAATCTLLRELGLPFVFQVCSHTLHYLERSATHHPSRRRVSCAYASYPVAAGPTQDTKGRRRGSHLIRPPSMQTLSTRETISLHNAPSCSLALTFFRASAT